MITNVTPSVLHTDDYFFCAYERASNEVLQARTPRSTPTTSTPAPVEFMLAPDGQHYFLEVNPRARRQGWRTQRRSSFNHSIRDGLARVYIYMVTLHVISSIGRACA
mmetsp:Transcript_1058/g.3303  ORF Transcript_1058/g.3303 Transcript_1058/m.3303 type:complete len:107 (-) Transcript_1058:356-676(-)